MPLYSSAIKECVSPFEAFVLWNEMQCRGQVTMLLKEVCFAKLRHGFLDPLPQTTDGSSIDCNQRASLTHPYVFLDVSTVHCWPVLVKVLF